METTCKKRVRWSHEEWDTAFLHGIEQFQNGTEKRIPIPRFLEVAQEILGPDRKRRPVIPDNVKQRINAEFDVIVGEHVVIVPPAPKVEEPAPEPVEAPQTVVKDVDITDLYMVACEIRDLLQRLAPAEESKVVEGVAPEEEPPPSPIRVVAKKKVYVVGLTAGPFQHLEKRWKDKFELIHGWNTDRGDVFDLPKCDYIVVVTKFINHKTVNKLRAQMSPDSPCKWIWVNGGISSVTRELQAL